MANWDASEVNETRKADSKPLFAYRFRGYLPVVIDIETAGFNANTDAVLEIAASTLDMDENGTLHIKETHAFDVEPFEGANLEQSALDFTGINPNDPMRAAQSEAEVLQQLFRLIRKEVKINGCKRAIIVAHNAHFDQSFLNAAVDRCQIKRNPFHPFSSFDTASLAGLAFGHTVLAKACAIAKIPFDNNSAHSAAYDAQVTAKLFCQITNQWRDFGGWDMALEAQMQLAERQASVDVD